MGRKTVDPTKFRPAVVWVMANYYYTVTFDDVLLGSRPYTVLCSTDGKHARVVGSDNIPKGYNKFSYTATAFLLTAKDVWELTDMLPILGTRLI